jgi:excinuclease ABC subunit A
MPGPVIAVRGARQNNLAGVDVDIPRGRLVAITGVSGSGKSSLAFDTLFREGQRRFLETLSAYARQFLGRMEKPAVDHVDGLSPAIAVDQHSVQRGPRSTVGTLTEIHDYLRVLYARAGTAHCPKHDLPLSGQTPEGVVQQVRDAYEGRQVSVLAPVVRDRKGEFRALFEELRKKGFVRARIDGQVLRLEHAPELERYKRHRIELVLDRLTVSAEQLARLREAVSSALAESKGDVIIVCGEAEQSYSTLRSCPQCGAEAPLLEPRLFSSNSPHGACAVCEGLGQVRAPSLHKLVRDPSLSLRGGALAVTRASGGALLFPRVDFRFLAAIGRAHGFDLDTPWDKLSKEAQRVILRGTGDERYSDTFAWNGAKYQGEVRWERRFEGVLPALEKAWKSTSRRGLVERYLDYQVCKACGGSRLNEPARHVRLGSLALPSLLEVPVGEVPALLAQAGLAPRAQRIARELIAEVLRRVAFLEQVGLGYLALGRSAETLSGGEAQRIRLAAQLGSGLQGILYVLDEPSIGLHPSDHERLLGALRALRDAGNSVIVVEHDEATLRAADWIIDVGPGAGREGGRIVASGTVETVSRADSPTGRFLRGELKFAAPAQRRGGNGKQLIVRGARGHNLTGFDARFPLGTFCVVSGVSGSGKSTLVEATLRRALERELGLEAPDPAPYDKLEGAQHVDELIVIDAAPIGRTPRSNPATYADAFGPIRELFASLEESRMRGWEVGRFSFNVAGGRCETCQGAGAQYVELQFLAPVTVPCPECGGHRFQQETLNARWNGKSIADVLGLTIDEALAFFAAHPRIERPLRALSDVGLGYLTLGQPSTTLSGGEAQRVKLAKYLQKSPRGHALFLLDEPTTGLHHADVQRLVAALQRLVDGGHSVIVIEHNLELVECADHVLELGPGAGSAGGRLIHGGTPEALRAKADSPTGRALRELDEQRVRGKRKRPRGAQPRESRLELPAREGIELRGARTHNLRGIDLDLPREALIVVTGPSGSGKSSLALDTLHAMGRARFVESLSTYARQFLGRNDKPPVDRLEGLGPSIAVEGKGGGSHPRSTVATTTEIHDHLRVLWARAAEARCPEHAEVLRVLDASQIARRVLETCAGAKVWIAAPLLSAAQWSVEGAAERWSEALTTWLAAGWTRVLVDGHEAKLAAGMSAPQFEQGVDLVVDRIAVATAQRARLAEAIEQAARLADGRVRVRTAAGDVHDHSLHGACSRCGYRLAEPLEPRHYSFNTHVGACPSCDGLGETWRCSAERLIDRPAAALLPGDPDAECAISGKLARYLLKGKGYHEHLLRTVAKAHGVRLERPFASLSSAQRELLLHGRGAEPSYRVRVEKSGERFESAENFQAAWPGLCGHVEAWHAKSEDPLWRATLETVMHRAACATCDGERLAPAPRRATLGRWRLPEYARLDVTAARGALAEMGGALEPTRRTAVAAVLAELESRLELLERVGLGYLALDRSSGTLSGGEARRVRLASALGTQLVGVCYVLDEPTVGLHPRDIDRLAGALESLRDLGNTVIAVEHDDELMRRADWIVELGPGAGRLGGEVVYSGTVAGLRAAPQAATGALLAGRLKLERTPLVSASPISPSQVPASQVPPAQVRPSQVSSSQVSPAQISPASLVTTGASDRRLVLRGARLHNLQGADLEVGFGTLHGVCGPSGSGKSSLVLDTLVPALRGEPPRGRWDSFDAGSGSRPRLLLVDATPLGRTPASVPATAVGLMDPLRELYARTPEAKARGYSAAHFSFNGPKGRCPACEGRGATQVEMQFLADLWLPCEECEGRRYRPEVLDARWRGKHIAEALECTVAEALELFEHHPSIERPLRALADVGLGYLQLGQGSTTLSVGEAQRVKLAAELVGSSGSEPCVVVLDEPSTGLATSDVQHLLRVLERLAERGDAVLLVEHHIGLLRCCDELTELGPAGGPGGGHVIARGSPQQLCADPASVTGPWLGARAAPDATKSPRGHKTREFCAR